MLSNGNQKLGLVVAGVAILIFILSVFMRKKQFPCNCPDCQEQAVVDAAQFPELGKQEEGTPVFVTFLYSILALFVIAGIVAYVANISGKGYDKIKKRYSRSS